MEKKKKQVEGCDSETEKEKQMKMWRDVYVCEQRPE